jgi:hypothetical protein
VKCIILFIFCATVALVTAAQTNLYQQDLEALKSSLEKTYSFREQIKGEKATAYHALYTQLLRDSGHAVNSFSYFYNLGQLLFPLKDNHLGFYQVVNYKMFSDKSSLDSFVASPGLCDHPKVQLDIDSLKAILNSKPADSIEGIYHYDSYFSVGLYREASGELTGIVVDTKVPNWINGQLAIKLYPYAQGIYKAIYAHPVTRGFILENNEKFRNETLINSKFYASFAETVYSKTQNKTDHVNLSSGLRFQFRKLNADIDYLLIRSFQNNKITKSETEELYSRIKDSLTAPNLVLDLRNNEGGAEGMGDQLYQRIRSYSKKGKVWILMNNGTLSQAEIQILRLIKLPNVKTVGQPTKGMLTYGSNYGKRVRLPSRRFECYPTDMRGTEEHLRYEDIGIQPDVLLNNQRDWLEQVRDIILSSS